MNQKQLKNWEKKRARGKSEVILRDGGILSLILIGIVASIIEIIIEFFANNFTFSFFNKSFQVQLFIRFMLAFPVGCLIGWLNWEISEWRYLRTNLKSK